MQLRVGTYNIAGGKSSHDLVVDGARTQRLLTKIRELRCDLLGLQEVRANPPGIEPNVAAEIAREALKAGYYACFGTGLGEEVYPERERIGGLMRGIYQGNMILSRYPISRYHSFLISDFADYDGTRDTEPRHVLIAKVNLGDDTPVYFAVTHLLTMRDRELAVAAERRKVQAERILSIMNSLPDGGSIPQLLVGDFNNNPFSKHEGNAEPEIEVLLSQFKDLSAGCLGTRWRKKNGEIIRVRIDRVFANDLVDLIECHPDNDPLDGTAGSEMFLNPDGLTLSDHRPAVITVRIS
jgi:endonuclease/exonuclease/phosphatase family metal-dependent hydrolase